ncbi:hypothetical protein N7517_008785 [Penicillium concentricum]|uniref:Uncharacterized protein n=1 Tax=Penicillium concentricum TaxID=293559 RepID=A0A9W9RVP2_9EURO|nr:uncharacterized protein N7517_008785 [Penicillium concentricum]KAJ5365899.1 hypothetical protein N7517_008785 [Penicillium concentricum]
MISCHSGPVYSLWPLLQSQQSQSNQPGSGEAPCRTKITESDPVAQDTTGDVPSQPATAQSTTIDIPCQPQTAEKAQATQYTAEKTYILNPAANLVHTPIVEDPVTRTAEPADEPVGQPIGDPVLDPRVGPVTTRHVHPCRQSRSTLKEFFQQHLAHTKSHLHSMTKEAFISTEDCSTLRRIDGTLTYAPNGCMATQLEAIARHSEELSELGVHLELHLSPCHCKVPGNEAADSTARKTASAAMARKAKYLRILKKAALAPKAK